MPERHEPDIGELNYPYLFELIDSLGYDGWIGCEYRPRAAHLGRPRLAQTVSERDPLTRTKLIMKVLITGGAGFLGQRLAR